MQETQITMGNNTASPTSSVSNTTNSSSVSSTGVQTLSGNDFYEMILSLILTKDFEEVIKHCHTKTDTKVWLGIKIFMLLTGLIANISLMWMLVGNKRLLSASEVLGLNLSALDILYCFSLPLDICNSLYQLSENALSVAEAFSVLIIFSCPLLLTFMCFERYLAAARPVAYMKLGKPEYRAALCGLAWLLTLAMVLLAYFLGVFSMVLYLALTISMLFLLMLLCLVGIVWVLCQRGPGEGSGTNVPLKRRALKNIIAVMGPSVVAYTPLVALIPYMAVIQFQGLQYINSGQCYIVQVLLAFPNIGLYIGPIFYLSRIRQLTCWKRVDKEFGQQPYSKTQAE